MAKLLCDRYTIDPDDGLRVEVVGSWSLEKHSRLRKYVDITKKTRAKFDYSGAAYIDLYCGPGKIQVRGEESTQDGSPLLALRESMKGSPFTSIHIADLDKENLESCAKRLRSVPGAPKIFNYHGKAEDTAYEATKDINKSGLHLALLDPYSIGAIPFSVIETLSQVKRMDMIIHVSEMDLNRNIRMYRETGVLEQFAPGCEEAVDWRHKDEIVRAELFSHWRSKLEELDYIVGGAEKVSGDKNQPFYWLVSVSRNDLGKKFWDEIRHVEPQRGFNF
jgi:three-Cys-motif partner protein